MNVPVLTLPELTQRLLQLERQVVILQSHVERIKQPVLKTQQAAPDVTHSTLQLVDKAALRRTVDVLFEQLGIRCAPVGALALQAMMRRRGLGHNNEFSQALIAAREE